MTTLTIGTPLRHRDMANDRLGYVAECFEPQHRTATIGASGFVRVTHNYRVVWVSDEGKGEAVSELPNTIAEDFAKRAEGFDDPISPDAIQALEAEANAHQDEQRRRIAEASERAKIERDAFVAEARDKLPSWAKAVIVAEYDIDDCDSMTDYFNTKTGKVLILGFSKHNRDLFPELRKAAANAEETRHLSIKPEKPADADEWWHAPDEHREKYSMGHGYYLKASHRYSSGWVVRKINLYGRGADSIPTGEWRLAPQRTAPKPAQSAPQAVSGSATIEQHTHTKHGFEMWLVIPSDRLERDHFNALRDSAKSMGGWYSRKWGSTPGGFAFKSPELAEQFLMEHFGPTDTPPKPRKDIADKLRDMADRLQPQIDHKLGDRLTNTPKRQREAASARIDGYRLERTQQAMRALADLHEAGEVPQELANVTTKDEIYDLLQTKTVSNGYYHIADTNEPAVDNEQSRALWALINGRSDEDIAADELREKIESLQFANIPGYFPTPPAVVERMIEIADISCTDTVLEPSAGAGAILDKLPENCATVVCEVNHTLCDILQRKGYDARPLDFLQMNGAFQFDKVLMNPPFERMQDVDHVRHAFDKLKPGGRLVAIMSPGPFFRSDKKAADFREWLDELGGEAEDLPPGTFESTGVASKLVTIEKP